MLMFLKWRSSLWSAKALLMFHQPLLPGVQEGLTAYAFRQADVFISLHSHFRSLWEGFKVLDTSPDPLVPTSIQIEKAMQGVDGGDVDLG